MAAVRELIQNARDAVLLKSAVATSAFERAALTLPINIKLDTKDPATLEVADQGVGMSRRVMTEYLVSIASDYWNSEQFFSDFPSAFEKGFRPAGKFGIGFVSVFMLGDEVQVESNRDGGERLRLTLRGIGRRGEVRELPAPSGSGSSVKVRARKEVIGSLKEFPELIRAYAPMLRHDLRVEVDGNTTEIRKGWWKDLNVGDFAMHVLDAVRRVSREDSSRFPEWDRMLIAHRSREQSDFPWPGEPPEWVTDNARLIAHPHGTTLLCLKGLALAAIPSPGFTGFFDSERVTPDVSRRKALDFNVDQMLSEAKLAMRPSIINNLNLLSKEGFVADKIEFLARCVAHYGREVLLESDLPWLSVVRPPGEVILLRCKEMLKILVEANSVLIGFSTDPWRAMRRWSSDKSKLEGSQIAIVLDDTRMDRRRYASEKRAGALIDLWPYCQASPLFGTVVALVGEAWQAAPVELVRQEGWELESTVLFGEFRRTG